MEHKHHGKSSAKFFDCDDILNELSLEGNETFMDAGCGDGYISIRAIEKYLQEGTVYAVDIHNESIECLNEYKLSNDAENLINVVADIAKGIPCIEDCSVDVVLMVNVFHGFYTSKEDEVIEELSRLLKNEGKIALVDFNKIEIPIGPPLDIKSSPNRLEELFAKHGFKRIYLNDKFGVDYPNGKSHYMIIFKKEYFR